MASELQRRKVAGVFHAMDVDGDGFLEREDFQALAKRWTAVRNLTTGDPDYAGLTELMMGCWEILLAASDLDRDDRVSLDEVLLVVDRLPAMLDAVKATAAAIFAAIDKNGDDLISANEYRQLIETWTGRPVDTDSVFHRLDLDGDGHLSREEFTAFWVEFWAGDDPTSPGTWAFGKFDPTQPVSR
jgi:Ca2+-binding EF-hand superfamily protein